MARMSWEQAVQWARETPEMAPLVQDCYYDDPIDVAAARFLQGEEWAAIKAILPAGRGDRVIEIGAGRGILSWAFAKGGSEVFAAEPNPSALVGAGAIRDLCTRTGEVVRVMSSGAEALDAGESFFDYGVCRGVLHHLSDLDRVAKEMFRVLKPGGRFLAIKEHVAETPSELRAFLDAHPLHHLYCGEHAYPRREYVRALRAAGFRVRQFGPFDHPVTSAPTFTTSSIRAMAQRALAARMPTGLAMFLARRTAVVALYRRWLTARDTRPGRLYSFVCDKPR